MGAEEAVGERDTGEGVLSSLDLLPDLLSFLSFFLGKLLGGEPFVKDGGDGCFGAPLGGIDESLGVPYVGGNFEPPFCFGAPLGGIDA